MMSASTITATSRQKTGQSRSVRLGRLPSRDAVGPLACWLVLPALSLALATPWLPIYNVLAGNALCLKLLFERVHGQRDWSSGPMASGGTKIEVRHFNAIEDEISGS
jgi:hypothetical protein